MKQSPEDMEDFYRGHIVPVNSKGWWTAHRSTLITGYEDVDIGDLDYQKNESFLGEADKEADVLVVRDFFNWLASRAMKLCWPAVTCTPEKFVLYEEMMREALEETNHLRNRVVVNFNKWFSEGDYRRELEKKLELPETEDGLQVVMGLGSSFDGHSFDGNAQEMKVLNRWEMIGEREKEWYNVILAQNRTSIELSERFFGRLDGTEELPGYKKAMEG
jgi:hypothetical protein